MQSNFVRRSLLYIPGSNEKMLGKAVTLSPDGVILDLEDAVSLSEKVTARKLVSEMLPQIMASGKEVLIRINGLDTQWAIEDLQIIVPLHPHAIVLPKANRKFVLAADCILSVLERKFGFESDSVALVPLIETTEGVMTVYEILSLCKRINGVQFGAEDLTKELGIARTADGNEVRFAREQLAFAARARGIDSLDTPFSDVKNIEALRRDVDNAKAIGFTGKTCIHPSHVDIIHEAFTPSEEEVKHARAVLEAMREAVAQGKGACMYEGKMIDAPIAERAQKVVDKAERITTMLT